MMKKNMSKKCALTYLQEAMPIFDGLFEHADPDNEDERRDDASSIEGLDRGEAEDGC